MRYKIIWSLTAPLLLCAYGWLCWQLVMPLFKATSVVLYEPIGYILAILFAGFGGGLVLFYNRFFELFSIKNKELPKISMRIMFIGGGVIGLVLNIAIYNVVIKPNNMIECPLQVGYKKNLMREYVTDLSLCEKF
ncbi:hypothetical protein [uncultured Photobacterium sp.]|uniref:hypothetical protein n=1 Tax=uncultured Photobacterium sp. TaxID=173973 RepID=UPI0026307674|nr:hypothetical protein [uncultured Photobacterium sp.]